MKETRKKLILWLISFMTTICLFSFTAQAQDTSSEISDSAETNTYVFMSEESTIVQTGGIAGVHWIYSIEGLLQLTLDPNTGTASFVHIDANATDDSTFQRTLDPNEVFNMTSLAGTFIDDTTISFTGKAKDDSDVLITVTIDDDLLYLVGETTPPPNSADFFLFSLDAIARRKYGGGTGRPNDPYLIYTAEQMNVIGLYEQDWAKHFRLMTDIDLSDYKGTDYNIIGYWVGLDSPENRPFRGVFDGNGHTISNFTYTCTDVNCIGLFGYIEAPEAAIRGLGLIDPNIDAGTEGWGIGSLAGYLREGAITDCYVEGGSVSGNEEVGGLLGINWECAITNCYSTSIVSGNEDVGGLAGDNVGTITNCYSTGSVSGDEWVGGLVGFNWGTITNCYSTGLVEGAVDVGGLVGYGGGAIASFWDIETSGQLISAGGIGKTTAEMQMANTFVGWSFGLVWTIDEGKDYPRLWW